MKEEILTLFLEQHLTLNEICEELNTSKDEVRKILAYEHYLIHPQRTFEQTLKIKEGADYYLAHPEESATKVAKQFGICVSSFCKCLNQMGIEVENKQNKTKFNENIFDNIDTEDKAYWLGFIFADGSIDSSPLDEYKKPRYQFELSLSDVDHSHLDKFNKFMEHEKDNVITGKVRLNGKEFQRCRWIINNKHLWTTLNNIGCTPNKSFTLEFPDIPANLRRHFIRGYFDGDGSLGIYDEHIIQCSCLGTTDMLDNILSDLKLDPQYHHDKRHSEYTYSFQLVSQKCIDFLNYIYKDSTIYLDRKYQKYLDSCRLWEKSHGLLSDNIGESCDANSEIN
jgi:hypothetical protein